MQTNFRRKVQVAKDVVFEIWARSVIYWVPGGKCGKFGWYRCRQIKICTHAKFRKYAQNIGWDLFSSTLLILRKSRVFYSCTLAAVNNTYYGSGGQTDPDPSASCTWGMSQGCLQVLGLSRLLLGVPVKDPAAGAGLRGPDARLGSAEYSRSTAVHTRILLLNKYYYTIGICF